jgi:two-component system, OmpR family, response regulator MprA
MDGVVDRDRARIDLTPREAGADAGEQGEVGRDREHDQLRPGGVLREDDADAQPRRQEADGQVPESLQALMESSPQSYIPVTVTNSLILVVEDDARLAATLERVLVAEGHEVARAGDGLEALRRAKERPPDLVILDVMLPGLDGIGVCRRLRATAQFPILMLTALDGTEDRVRGLDSGADDYLVKPFAYQELLARVRALLRRAGPADHLRFADLVLEPGSRGAWRGTRALSLTHTEYTLLEHFLRHPRQVLTREQLLEAVWASEPESDNVVAVYVGYVRQKLEEGGESRLLHTIRGSGYALRET